MTEERKEFEKLFHPLYQFYHDKNNKLKQKEVNFLNHQKIPIFRGEDFIKYTTSNFEAIDKLAPDNQKTPQAMARYLIENKIIIRLERHPQDPQKKWPKKVILTKTQIFADEGFYTWNIVIKNKMNNVKMTIILVLVFLICLYPIWPFTFKYGIFKFTLYLSVFFIGLLVLRIILYIISRLCGYSFWILPNINDDSLGLLGIFKPLYSIYKFNDGMLEISLRLIGVITFIGLIYFIIQEPSYINSFQEGSQQTIDDILEWGKDKLEGKQEPLHRRAIPDLSDLMREAEDEIVKQENTEL